MIKRKKDIERINDIIKSESDSVDKKFLELFSIDINKVVGEYFNVSKNPLININKEAGEVVVSVSFSVDSIKLFKNI